MLFMLSKNMSCNDLTIGAIAHFKNSSMANI